MSRKIERVLLIDVSTYQVDLNSEFRQMLSLRLKAEAFLRDRRVGSRLLRPSLSYSQGLLTVAAYLERDGFSVRYMVFSDPVDRKQLDGLIKEADVLGFYVITPCAPTIARLLRHAKRLNPELITLAGGPHVETRPLETLDEIPELDFVLVGGAGTSVGSLLRQPQKVDQIPGVAYRGDGGQSVFGKTLSLEASELRLRPAYHLLSRNLEDYAHNIQFTRGCPFDCDFCVSRRSRRKTEMRRDIDSILDDLVYFDKHLPSGTLVHFSDPVFTLHSPQTLELCRRLEHADLDLHFSLDTRLDLLEEDVVRELTVARFVYFRLGIESMQSHILSMVHKDLSPANIHGVSAMLRKLSPEAVIHAYMMAGLPGSTRESILEDAEIIRRLVLDDVVDIVGNKILVPYPGTEFFSRPDRWGMTILSFDWGAYDRMSLPVYRFEALSEFEIYFGFLAQESTLTEAYVKKAGGYSTIRGVENLDYVYSSYVNCRST